MDFGVLVDVCLGVLSVMILFSLAATAINEMIADNILNMRGKSLHDAIVGLASKYVTLAPGKPAETVVDDFYKVPAIKALMEKRSLVKGVFASRFSVVKGELRPPSAIEPATFAQAMKKALGESAATAVEEAVGSIEADFTLTMDRVSGWYVRKVRTSLFFIGLILAIGANVDLLRYAQGLANDANLRARVDATVGMIDAFQTPQGTTPPAELSEAAADLRRSIDDLNSKLGDAGVAVGWQCVSLSRERAAEEQRAKAAAQAGGEEDDSSPFCSAGHELNGLYPTQFVGWLIIAFGVTLGAQFWFDLFRMLVNLRTAGKTGGAV